MRKRFLCLLWIGLWLCPALSLAAEAPALSLQAEHGCLRLHRGDQILREWPLGKPTAIDLYWDESHVYAQIALDEEDAAPVLLCFAYDAAGWSVEGMDRVRWRGAPTPELWRAWGLEDIESSPDGELPSEISLENSNLLPCCLHTRDSVPLEEQALHSALQPCGQAYECDASHAHMVYACGAHYSCQGGEPSEHLKYATCDHYLCDGMPHPALDCGTHSACDADPSEHALLPCGHFRCDPACDHENALPIPAAGPSEASGDGGSADPGGAN